MEVSFGFDKLPLWRGTQNRPGVSCALPFRIGWHSDGYIYQNTSGTVREQILSAYADQNYSHITNLPGTSEWATRLGEHSIEWVKHSCRSLDEKRILEIGAGNTYIAERLSEEFNILQYVIVDPSIQKVHVGDNIKIYKEYFEKKHWVGQVFDLVFGFGILEHVRNPLQLLLDLNAILLPCEGKAVLCFPNTERQLLAGDLTVLIHEHLSYLTQNTVAKLTEQAGFEIIECETNLDSISMIIQAVTVPKRVKGQKMDDVLPKAARQFDQNIIRVEKIIRGTLMNGEKIAFHGACNGLNNLLYLTGLHEDSEFRVFDGDHAKVGRYMPTCKRPILHSGDQAYREADRVFVASTTFYSEIRDFLHEIHEISPDRIVPVAPVDQH